MTFSPELTNILLVDDDRAMRDRTSEILLRAGFHVIARPAEGSISAELTKRRHDVVMAALDWTSTSLAASVGKLKQQAGSIPLVLLVTPDKVALAVNALKYGADEYLLRPPDPVELKNRLGRLLDRHALDSQITIFQDELSKKAGLKDLESRSPSMLALIELVLRVAPLRSTLLITGESGVGKELVARAIHFNSPRKDGLFMALNCAAIPDGLIESELFGHEKGSFTGAYSRMRGKFEVAHRGTLFLDEIAEMAPATQAKLLRVIEQKEFMRVGGDRDIKTDVRVITATNASLSKMVSAGHFREDLYYRLKVITVHVPPLRERREDIPALVSTFLDELARANAISPKQISASAMLALQNYHWPGNVRELKNFIESLLVGTREDVIQLDDLPASMTKADHVDGPTKFVPGTTLATMERELIRRTLEHTGGNRTHSATLLDIGVRTLQRKIHTYGIRIAPTRRRARKRIDDSPR
jgi:DNA-binding NtrC family response regulator